MVSSFRKISHPAISDSAAARISGVRTISPVIARLGAADIVNRDRQIDHCAGSRVRVATGAALPGTR